MSADSAADSANQADRTVWGWLIAVAVALTALRIWALAASQLDLHGDEAQYWLWSRNFDWGYFSKPPLVAWAILGTTSLFGDAEWAVKLASPLAQLAGGLALAALAWRMFGRIAGALAGLLWMTTPGSWASAGLISTDALLLPLWAGALYGLWRLVEAPQAAGAWRWAVLLGLAGGLGFLAKYAMGYFLLCLALAAAWSPPVRRAVLNRKGAIAGGVALTVIAPNLLWNAANNFATVSHTAANANLGGSLFNPDELLSFVADQALLIGPVLFFALCAAVWSMSRGQPDTKIRFLIAFILPPILIIAAQAFISRANGNWAASAYPAAAVLLAGWAMTNKGARNALIAGVALNILLGIIIVASTVAPAQMAALPKPIGPAVANSLKRTVGWDETAALVVAQARRSGPYSAIVTDHRLTFNALAYALRDEPEAKLLRMWRVFDEATNQAEAAAPLTQADGARVLILNVWPRYKPLIEEDFTHVSPAQEQSIALYGDRTRTFMLQVGEGFAPRPRDDDFKRRARGEIEE
jgi:4-amino-4-deoxy-L-arabinose transferase-like glycosyltransferase